MVEKEVKNAREEGANFEFNVQPVELVLDTHGRASGIRFLRTRLGEPDGQGDAARYLYRTASS